MGLRPIAESNISRAQRSSNARPSANAIPRIGIPVGTSRLIDGRAVMVLTASLSLASSASVTPRALAKLESTEPVILTSSSCSLRSGI
jgi:hypothetical protein